MKQRFPLAFALAALAVVLTAIPATANEFYKGKSIRLIIGYGPGGGIDAASRPIARHISRFIPGNPNIVVQNMEGATGILAANFIANQAAPDGLTIAIPGRSWFVEGLIKTPGARFDPTRLTYIGSTGAPNSLMWVRSDTGLKTMKDLQARSERLVFGALSPSTQDALVPALLAASGLPIRVVRGYNSSAKVIIAIEQGEVPATFLNEDAFFLRPDLIDRKVIFPMLQSKPVLPNIPLVHDYVREVDHPLLKLATAAESFGVPIVAPPGVPADLVEILQKAFFEMAQDQGYRADAQKVSRSAQGALPIPGAKLLDMMKELGATATPEVVARYLRLRD